MRITASYIRGIVQRRYRYKVRLDRPEPLAKALEMVRGPLAARIEEEWGGRLCPLPPPHLWLLLLDWMGGTLPADVSLCAPISHPAPAGLERILEVPFDRLEVCLEPIAPPPGPPAYSAVKVPGLKLGGRVALRGDHAVVKLRGLYFLARVEARGDPLGGVELRVARYGCFSYGFQEAMRAAAAVLRR